MTPKFIISHLDEQLGPFVEAELKNKWASGAILPIDYVYDESKQDWVLIHERFAWATANPDGMAPPPLREGTSTKKRPPDPPANYNMEMARLETLPPHTQIPVSTLATQAQPLAKAIPIKVDGTSIKLTDGIGETQINSLQPGQVELVLQDSATGQLKLQSPVKINVRSAEPHAVEWSLPYQLVVGQEVEILIQAFDGSRMLCAHYDDTFIVRINGVTGQ